MLRENAINFFGVDGAKRSSVAERVGPSIEQIAGGPEIDSRLLEHLANRTGILKPAEGEGRVAEYDTLLGEDLAKVRALAAR
jgi:hypothetical protein